MDSETKYYFFEKFTTFSPKLKKGGMEREGGTEERKEGRKEGRKERKKEERRSLTELS